jgi:type I restriction enzyme S subunit
MNPERLLAMFEEISEAPDAIPRLRRFILDLAVRGKLVEQDPEDEPAEVLLKRLADAKQALIDSKLIKKPKPYMPITEGEMPIPLPKNWAWLRLIDIGRLAGGMTPSMSRPDYWDGDIPWLSPKDIKADEVDSSEMKITAAGLKETRLELYPPGSLFIVARSGILKRTLPVAINHIPAAANQDMKVLVPYLKGGERYLQIMFRGLTDFLLKELVKTGTTVQSLKYAEFEQQPFPLPPLAEQHRIVAKVDELMALCDQLEAARLQREQCRERLVAASLQRLNQPSGEPESFRSDARFALQVLPSFTSTPAQIKQIRQTILNLAVRGKLVEQDPQDEPAIITITGALLAAADSPRKKGRRKASWTPPTENENQELPAGWHLFSLAELVDPASPLSYGVLVPGDNVPDGIPFVRAQDLMLKDHPALPGKRIAQEIDAKYGRTRLTGGEILICVVGSIGKIGIAPEHWSGANIARAVARLKLVPEVSAAYMLLALQSGMIQGFFKDSTRTLAQPTLNISLIEVAPIPLPPLAEQHRIVANVDELMALCDELEQHLSQAEQGRRGLLEAVLREALVDGQHGSEIGVGCR